MTTESDVEKKPEDQVQPAAAAAPVVDQPAAQTEDEKIWAEIMAAEAAETAPVKVNGEVVSHELTEPEPVVTESKDDAGKDASEGADKQPEAKPAALAPKEDPLANASPEIRAAFEAEVEARKKAEHAARSDASRIRSYQATVARLQGKADANKGAPAAKKTSEVLDEGLQEYPEFRKPVQDALAPIEKQLETLRADVSRQDEAALEEAQQHIRSQREVLEAAHPGWMNEYVTGARAKQFYDWVLDQPRKVRETVFVTNKDEIFDAKAGIEVFDAFKASLAPPVDPPPAKDGGQTQELSAKRAAQLDGTVSPRSPGGAPRVSGIPKEGDPQAMWNAIPDDNADDRLQRSGYRSRRA